MTRWMIVNVGIVLVAGALVIAFRSSPPLPDPNDPNDVGRLQPTVMRRNLKHASNVANSRVDRGELTESEAKERVSKSAEEILKNLEIDSIPDEDLWEYGEVLWTAKEWATAIPVLEKAVKVAKTEDRRVNDTLRLAKCYAATDQVDKAIELVRSVLNVGPRDSAPLMLGVTKELVPVARGKGKDAALAKLIADIIPIYENTVVDESTDAGKDFLVARPFHIREARRLIAELSTTKK